jgi:16S rRNA (guanine1207-N2)-methyltransferase
MSTAQSPVSQLLERNVSLFAGKRLLIAGYMEDNYPLALAVGTESTTLFTTDYSRWRQLEALQATASAPCSLCYDFQLAAAPPAFDALLLLLPKAKAEAHYLLANLLPHVRTDGDIFLAGDNRGGINGADKLLAIYAAKSQKLDSARRCSLVHATLPQPAPPFQLNDWLQEYSLLVANRALQVVALPGVFSADGLDEGTRLLLENLPPLRGRILDVGCGAGVIGSALCALHPELTVEMCDINALALESARRTLAANQLTAHVYPSDMLSDVQGQVQHIVTNPPFHAGLKTLYGPTEQLILGASHKLARQGSLLLVANAFLKYQPFLQQAFRHHQILAEDKKFRLYHSF